MIKWFILNSGRIAVKKKVVTFAFFLFSITLFCADLFSMTPLFSEKLPAERTGWSRYQERRSRLIEEIKNKYPDVDDGVVVLFSNFEAEAQEFRQEPHFYYLTGIKEPGTALLLDFSGESVLYIPNNLKERATWTPVQAALLEKDVEQLGFSKIMELEGAAEGPFFKESDRLDLCRRLS